MTEHRPILVPVGGFLGSGKTTLLITAARMLRQRGLRTAIIVNDQGSDLVDLDWVQSHDVPAGEVTDGCFCCRFSDLVDAAEKLHDAEVIFAEPVGSCTDLSATILGPLRQEFLHRFRVAPLTVLVDPLSVRRLQSNPDMAFLFRNQLAEADLVCFTRSDICEQFPELPGITPRRLSGRTGDGVAGWLDEVLFGDIPAGAHVLEIDYTRYAAAEAALAWFDCTVQYSPAVAMSAAMVVGPLLDELDLTMTDAGVQIAHMKILDRTEAGVLKAAITANGQEPEVEGDLTASPATQHSIVLNIRAVGEPVVVEELVRAALPEDAVMQSVQSFQPAPPKPERRI